MKTSSLPRACCLLSVGIALAVVSSDALSAQEESVRPGDRVRFGLPCDPVRSATPGGRPACTHEGTLVRITPDALELLVRGNTETYPVTSLTDLEVRRVEGPRWHVPASVGAVLGLVGTYAWLHSGGSTSLCDRSRNQDAIGRRECVGLTLLGGAAGAGVGALASRLLRTERWIPASLGRVDLSIGWR